MFLSSIVILNRRRATSEKSEDAKLAVPRNVSYEFSYLDQSI